jgi:hypothetical protein
VALIGFRGGADILQLKKNEKCSHKEKYSKNCEIIRSWWLIFLGSFNDYEVIVGGFCRLVAFFGIDLRRRLGEQLAFVIFVDDRGK